MTSGVGAGRIARLGVVVRLGLLMWLQASLPVSPHEGLPFSHTFRLFPQSPVPPMWPGLAIFDYDSDGDQDILITNGDGFPNGLLCNDGQGRFTNVWTSSLHEDIGGTGVVTGDIDNDGYPDVFVAGYYGYRLYLNRGDGRFKDITRSAGLDGARDANRNTLSRSAVFCDFDNDGFIDLYVGTMQIGWALPKNELYHNNGNRTFTEIAGQAGVASAITRTTFDSVGVPQYTTWAVTSLDYDNDGDQDLVAAVDFSSVALFKNELRETGKLHFTNVTVKAGLASTGNWMGLAVLDFDRDGWLDVFATNWGTSPYDPKAATGLDTLEHALYRNNGDGTFTNVARKAGVAAWEFGWGVSALDWDNDGSVDLYYAGNMAFPYLSTSGELGSHVFAEDNPGHLFLNNGNGTFTESSRMFGLVNRDEAGHNRDAKAVAVGDLNGDGFFEIVIGNSATVDVSAQVIKPGTPICFKNPGNTNHWLKVRLVGRKSNRSALGARVTVSTDASRQVRDVRSGSSFQSQDSYELGFGLGRQSRIKEITINWPSGLIQTLADLKADQAVTITEGAP